MSCRTSIKRNRRSTVNSGCLVLGHTRLKGWTFFYVYALNAGIVKRVCRQLLIIDGVMLLKMVIC